MTVTQDPSKRTCDGTKFYLVRLHFLIRFRTCKAKTNLFTYTYELRLWGRT